MSEQQPEMEMNNAEIVDGSWKPSMLASLGMADMKKIAFAATPWSYLITPLAKLWAKTPSAVVKCADSRRNLRIKHYEKCMDATVTTESIRLAYLELVRYVPFLPLSS